MLINNKSGAVDSVQIKWPGGDGIVHSTSASGTQVLTLERLGGDGTTFIKAGKNAVLTGNDVVGFTLDKCIIRLSMASGTNVYADVETTRISN